MKLLNWFFILIGILGLISVRIFEDRIFYDPFLDFFHLASKTAHFPQFSWLPLVGSHLFRFVFNLIFSLLIIQVIFNNKKWTYQSGILITIVFLITFIIYLYCLATQFSVGYLFVFYIRRFVIQPLILLLIIPIFFYRRELERKRFS